MFLNKVQIIGNLTKEIELRKTPNGKSVVSFSLATNETYKDANNKKVENVDYHNCTAWGRTAEVLDEYAIKGQKLYIEGKLKTDSYEKDGKTMYKTYILVSVMQLGAKPAGASKTKEQPAGPAETDEISVDEIPF